MTMAAEPPDTPASTPPAKPSNKFDPFHPDMPQIPGVRDAHLRTSRSASSANAKRFTQIGGVAAAALVLGVAILWWVKSTPRRAAESSAPETAATEASVPVASPPAPVPATTATEGPTVAATAEELSKPWASKTFNFVKPFTHENLNAIVIRLPGGGLWAFALQEPYGRCELEFVTDLSRLAKQYGYRASHPMVANPCNSTIYDPLKVGALGGGVWVRGEIVQGGGLRPPISINVRLSGNSIIADRIE
ncbi:MAG: hypothetical protein LAN18_11835 [Acidobacteriia bacterium]|nr:hypothetical protein [Terriglobia bacterium]